MTMTKEQMPNDHDFELLERHINTVLFNLMLAGRVRMSSKCSGIRWVLERDAGPYWLISIYGLGLDDQMGLDAVIAFLQEHDYDPECIEIILEDDDVAV